MTKIAIIIPSRLNAERLPDKPLKIINNKEMILHVKELAEKSDIGEVIIATPDQRIMDTVKNNGGNAVLTRRDHKTGTDRVFEVFKDVLNSNPEIIINLQGDMPNLDPSAIVSVANHMKKNVCDIATLASKFKNKEEVIDTNVVKVATEKNIENNNFSSAIDFFRSEKETTYDLIYHHIGIYAFTNKALMRYVSLERSKLEIKRKLEQLRALENKMKIDVGYISACPLSVDTEKDLHEIKKIMKNK